VVTVSGTTLAVRLDSAGDLLLTGPALRSLAAGSDRLVLLTGPRARGVAGLLPGVDDVLVWHCPWIDPEPTHVDRGDIEIQANRIAAYDVDRAVVFTSLHQSPLPTALVLRMAGVRHVAAISDDYPGALLDVRHRTTDDQHEVERALGLARAAGFDPPAGDRGLLAVEGPLPQPADPLPEPYVVLHPGTSVPARGWFPDRWAALADLLVASGRAVVVTGGSDEVELTRNVTPAGAVDLGGRTSWAELAGVLARADVVVVGNTGPAHLAAAVGAPVVSLFAPTVPARRWAPYGVPAILLGDQQAICRETRVTCCPYPGHPCLASVVPEAVLHAVEQLCGAVEPGRPDPALQKADA
jgi:ADP-heptose:LPS heptosyltransferase